MAISIQEIHVGETGLDFEILIKKADGLAADISLATVKEIRFQKPDGSHIVVTADFVTDGTDGWIKYVTLVTTFDQPGSWRYQGYLEIGPDAKWTNITKFRVYPNIPLE